MLGVPGTIAVCSFMAFLFAGADPGDERRPGKLLWEIGKDDGANGEFALTPWGYRGFKEDALFAAGISDPRADWPYVHPGPGDAWAGGRSHTFTIIFGVKGRPAGSCRLQVALLDTHSRTPPRLSIDLNGHAVEKDLPPGAGDASLFGDLAKGKKHRFDVSFPADFLVDFIKEFRHLGVHPEE